MHKLYDLGYQNLESPDLLLQVAEELNATVMDVRLKPYSRDARWNQRALARKLGWRYVHAPQLGNLNYKTHGAEIQIADLEAGLAYIGQCLEDTAVILMCVCGKRSICHRLVIANACIMQLGITSIPLDGEACKAIIGLESGPTQLSFDVQ